jgi:hypothetical protein
MLISKHLGWLFLGIGFFLSLGWSVDNAGLVEEHDLPQSLAIGESFTASWNIDINQTSGFARFQLEFPSGISVTPLQVDQASFSFQDGKAKFIWIEVPKQKTLHLELEITATEDFEGGIVTQWFSFIENGSRKDVEFEPHPIARAIEDKAIPPTLDPESLEVHRNWKCHENGNVGTMELVIQGFEPGQFLKITEYVSVLASITPILDGEADIRDRYESELVYIWQAAPETTEIRVSYSVQNESAREIHGVIAAVVRGQAIERLIPSIEPQQTAPSNPESTAQVEHDIAFRVQLLATHQDASVTSIKRTYAYPGEVGHELHRGWNKYTTGYFLQYSDARDKRVELRAHHSFPGPFVAAYRGEDRITVQEALLISHQTWIP